LIFSPKTHDLAYAAYTKNHGFQKNDEGIVNCWSTLSENIIY